LVILHHDRSLLWSPSAFFCLWTPGSRMRSCSYSHPLGGSKALVTLKDESLGSWVAGFLPPKMERIILTTWWNRIFLVSSSHKITLQHAFSASNVAAPPSPVALAYRSLDLMLGTRAKRFVLPNRTTREAAVMHSGIPAVGPLVLRQ
jgi:hypothetical protein